MCCGRMTASHSFSGCSWADGKMQLHPNALPLLAPARPPARPPTVCLPDHSWWRLSFHIQPCRVYRPQHPQALSERLLGLGGEEVVGVWVAAAEEGGDELVELLQGLTTAPAHVYKQRGHVWVGVWVWGGCKGDMEIRS